MLDEPTLNVKNDDSDYELRSVISGRFELVEVLGKGTYGTVYRALDKSLAKEVAVKILHYHLLQDGAAVSRFLKEAQSSCRLQHENIIATYAIGQTEELAPFIVMEVAPGITLKDWLQNNDPLFDQILIILKGITSGLAAAHAQRIVHRDLKPSNVIIGDSCTAKVLDFGVAKVLSISAEQHLTQTGAMLGTPAYMSPEVCTGKPVDERSDLYSLGCILYEMCTGEPPFTGSSPLDTMGKHLREEPKPLAAGMPTAFQRLLDRLLAKDPAQRYQSAQEVLKEIELIQATSLKLKQAERVPVSRNVLVRCLVLAAVLIIPYMVAVTSAQWMPLLPPANLSPLLESLWSAGKRDEDMRKLSERMADYYKNEKQFEQEVRWRQRVQSIQAATYEDTVLASYRLGYALSNAGFQGGEHSSYCLPAIKYYSDWTIANSSKVGLPALYKQVEKILPFPAKLDLRAQPIDGFWTSKQLGSICYEAGDFANADKILEMVVAEEKRHDTICWELVAELQAYRSRAKLEMNDRREALHLAREATIAAEKSYSPNVTTSGNNYRLLGQIWQGLDAKIAEQMYLKGIAADKKVKVPTYQYMTWFNLYLLYEKQKRNYEAAAAMKNAQTILKGRKPVGPV